jgi:hypothetical protein
MIFWPFCAFIWFKNIEKMLLQMTSGFLELESTLNHFIPHCTYFGKLQMTTRTVIVPSLTTMLRDDEDFLHGLVSAVCVI